MDDRETQVREGRKSGMGSQRDTLTPGPGAGSGRWEGRPPEGQRAKGERAEGPKGKGSAGQGDRQSGVRGLGVLGRARACLGGLGWVVLGVAACCIETGSALAASAKPSCGARAHYCSTIIISATSSIWSTLTD
jgi:hypothetical protein